MPSVWGSRGQEVYTVGLTGGIASGKSEVCKELRNLGAYVIDADEVARDVVKPGLPAYKQILSVFGPQVLEDSGKIDREALGKLVFLDPRKRTLLNRITHPCIAEEITRRLVDFAEGNEQPKIVIIDAALIVDVGAENVFNCIVVVDCEPKLQVKRLVELRGMNHEEARTRLESQISGRERVAKADLVVENNGNLDELGGKVRSMWDELQRRVEEAHS